MLFVMFLMFSRGVSLGEPVGFMAGNAAVDSNGFIGVINGQKARFFDDRFSDAFSYSSSGTLYVYAINDSLYLVDIDKKVTLEVHQGLVKSEFANLYPRWLGSDRGRVLIFPTLSDLGDPSHSIQPPILSEDQGFLKEIIIKPNGWGFMSRSFFKTTPGLKRVLLNWKGFFVFEQEDEKLAILNQNDPFLFDRNGEKVGSRLDLPSFVYDPDPVEWKKDEIQTKEVMRGIQKKIFFGNSRIMNVFRYEDGFIICYIGPGQPIPQHMSLALFDKDWKRIGDVQEIPGWLIGIHEGQGIMITFPDSEGNSRIEKVGLGN